MMEMVLLFRTSREPLLHVIRTLSSSQSSPPDRAGRSAKSPHGRNQEATPCSMTQRLYWSCRALETQLPPVDSWEGERGRNGSAVDLTLSVGTMPFRDIRFFGRSLRPAQHGLHCFQVSGMLRVRGCSCRIVDAIRDSVPFLGAKNFERVGVCYSARSNLRREYGSRLDNGLRLVHEF